MSEKEFTKLAAGQKVKHMTYGEGYIRVLKPGEKSLVEFLHKPSDGSEKCKWINNEELEAAR